ncbi:MAG: metal ABC transporter permease [Candidatus Omnitrophica bacterium]|nr:metal ABC transporter permease [Candidatus Omnitrophota bacterium]
MIEILYKIIESILPFTWVKYEFMKNALLAVILVTPVFALVGTMVISKRMAFFSDVLGHSALTGVAIGVILGLRDPTLSMVILGILLAITVVIFKGTTQAASDTVLGVFFAMVVALGIVILSRGGGFAKYTSYLIGDILAVSRKEIVILVVITAGVLLYWVIFGNRIILVSVNSSLAASRGVNVLLMEISFAVLVAVIVALSIRLVGILIINSLLILPAAASRNISRNMHSYTMWAIAISLMSGIAGLIVSYYWGTASGATIVLFAAFFYCVTALFRINLKRS